MLGVFCGVSHNTPGKDTAIKNTKPAAKPFKLADEKGLYLLVNPSGGKLWRMKYRFEGKEKLLAFGTYPTTGLKEARGRMAEAGKLLANGADPGAVKKAQKVARLERAANSFEAVAREWFEQWRGGVSEAVQTRTMRRLEKDVFPIIGDLPVVEVNAPKVLEVLWYSVSTNTTRMRVSGS
jgi:hypothetical protein